MGRFHLEHLGGNRLYSCVHCDTFLTNRSELISTRFTGATGRAFLFNKVVNLKYSETQDRVMLTGRHIVRDVACKACNTKLGWIYEYATEENQRYKEGRVILEKALINETDGIEDYVPAEANDRDANNGNERGNDGDGGPPPPLPPMPPAGGGGGQPPVPGGVRALPLAGLIPMLDAIP